MLTFEQFYKEFLTEAKYLPGVPGGFTHDPNTYRIISYNNGNYSIQQNNGQDIGTIVPNPPKNNFGGGMDRLNNIHAALGVVSRDNAALRTQSKIYAFHLAKNKLDKDSPGPTEGNESDLEFFRNTYNDTASLLEKFINQHGNDNVTVVHPYSSNLFNANVLRAANINEQNRLQVDKFTYSEACATKWNNHANTGDCIKNFTFTDNKKIKVYTLLRYLGRPERQNNIDITPLEDNDFVSLEKLAQALARIVNNTDNRYENFYTYITDVLMRDNSLSREEKNKIQQNFPQQGAQRQEKSWLLEQLAAVYFKDLPDQAALQQFVAVVDDNINSMATYNAVNSKLFKVRRDIKIHWFVGIVPLKSTPEMPAVREQQRRVEQQLQQTNTNAKDKALEGESKLVNKAIAALKDLKLGSFKHTFEGTSHNTNEKIDSFIRDVKLKLRGSPLTKNLRFNHIKTNVGGNFELELTRS
jgi:hypothetical protein